MSLRARAGELLVGLILVGAGLFWISQALRLALWDGFAPGSGLLPLVYGVLLVALAAAALAVDLLSGSEGSQEKQPVRRPLLVLLVLTAGVLGLEHAGFAASIFLATLFLYAVVERHAILPSLVAAAGTAGALTVVFRNWLGVPLPSGPWGF